MPGRGSNKKLAALALKLVEELRPNTTICPGMLSRKTLEAAGLEIPEGQSALALMRPLFDELREQGKIKYMQGGRTVPRSRKELRGPIRVAPAARPRPRFDYDLDYRKIDFRERPDLYRVGVGEQGVLLVEPYKSEILPHWRFKTPEVARDSARAIYKLFRGYLAAGDFVGTDMARKFLQMGFTRARRYANHSSGRKYDKETGAALPQESSAREGDKAAAARIFYEYYVKARETSRYKKLKERHQAEFG